MKKALEKLSIILNQQIQLYNHLLSIAKKEQKVLVNNMPEILPDLIGEEEKLVLKIEDIEIARRQEFKVLANHLGIEQSELTLQKLIGHVPSPHSNQLEEKYNRLAETIDELSKVNYLNVNLINNSLKYSDYLLKLVARKASSSEYSTDGNKTEMYQSRFVDYRS